MGAQTPILRDIEQHRKTWVELWYRMADGDVTKYNEIKRLDALGEFWQYFALWRDKQLKQLEQYNKEKRKK